MAKLFTDGTIETIASEEWVNSHEGGASSGNCECPPSVPGGTGVISVPSEHFFTSEAERDAFFTLTIDEGTFCVITTSPPILQKYQNGVWTDITPIIQGQKGDPGEPGIQGEQGIQGEPGSYNDLIITPPPNLYMTESEAAIFDFSSVPHGTGVDIIEN
jgi:hypothetical protein